MSFWILAIFLIVLLLALLIYYYQRSRPKKEMERFLFGKAKRSFKPSKKEKELEKTLLNLVNGRDDVAQRLVELEQSRHPGESREWCLQKAIDAIRRERR